MHAKTYRSHGFTLVELLVVVAVICILIGLLMPALAILRRSQAKASTLDLIQHLTTALTNYLRDYPLVGDDGVATGVEFPNKPYEYLVRRHNASGVPYLELGVARLSKTISAGVYGQATMADAEHITDHFKSSNHSNLIKFVVLNDKLGAGASAKWYTYEIQIISTAGTPNQASDDLIFKYTADSKQWERVK